MLESSWNRHPAPGPWEKLSSIKSVSGVKKVGDCFLRNIFSSTNPILKLRLASTTVEKEKLYKLIWFLWGCFDGLPPQLSVFFLKLLKNFIIFKFLVLFLGLWTSASILYVYDFKNLLDSNNKTDFKCKTFPEVTYMSHTDN